MFLITELVVLLTTNLILTQALGTSTLFIAAGSRKNLIWTAVTITLFTTLGSCSAYIINIMLPESLGDLTLLLYTVTVGMLYLLLLAVMYYLNRKNFESTRKYIHISAFNCAVMGTLFTVTEKVGEYPSMDNIGSFALAGAEAGLGFIIASLILTATFRRLTSAKVPASFRGFPAMLVYLGIISMAVYALK